MNNAAITKLTGQVNLTAIMVTGGVDLAARMASDRLWTLDLMERDRNFMQEQCQYFQGQVLAYTSDGLLAYFSSAMDAVSCALEIQSTFIRAAANMQPRDVLSYTIGIHWGEISVTEQNISGSGIAIATSLKSEVQPSTIGISQSIYDYVRTGLPIAISYLGQKPQDLANNIYESIQVYQITPEGIIFTPPVVTPVVSTLPSYAIYQPPSQSIQSAINLDSVDITDFNEFGGGEFDGEFNEPAKELFDEIVLELENSDDLIKVKQLLFYACIHKWESDRTKLERVNLKGLIQELIELTLTFKQLKSLMAELIQTIDSEYAAIAAVIITEVGKLYADYQADDQETDMYDEIVQSLEDLNKDVIRIKRLIFYICRQALPPERSQTLTFKTAIQTLPDLYPTLESLRLRLKELTNSQPEYGTVVDIIVDDLSGIYPTRSALAVPPRPSLPTIIERPNERPTEPQYLTRIPTNLAPVAPPAQAPEIASGIAPLMAKYQPDTAESQLSLPEIPQLSAGDRQALIAKLELFDLRLEIMKYVNPLRAKILIFSVLNDNTQSTNENFAVLRTQELDDLLRDLLTVYKTYPDLEVKLKASAKRLHESSEYIQATSAIVKAIKPIYEQLGNAN